MEGLKRTPLFSKHKELGARFVPFAGWEMPIQYSGLVDEHQSVRSSVGVFDVSHMGEVFVRGPEALSFLQYVTSNDVSKLKIGRAQYSFILNEEGGVIDDIIVYRLDEQEYLLCVNASNAEKDFAWLEEKLKGREQVAIENASPWYVQLAIQGPKAAELMSALAGGADFEGFRAFSCQLLKLPEVDSECIIARTGYTGEDGFEIFCPVDQGEALWDRVMSMGQGFGLKPIGLGARDTLRLEAALPLHGHELSETLPAWSAGLGFAIKMDKESFVGKEALEAKRDFPHKLVGLEVLSPGIVREGVKLYYPNGSECGWVSSGTKPPTVAKAIALGFVPKVELGAKLEAEVRGRRLEVEVVELPFYRRGQ